MDRAEYVLRIDTFTPETLPMARLAEYLGALAKLVGHAEHTHFDRVAKGSAKLVSWIEDVDAPKVERRLREVAAGDGPKEARKAFQDIDNLLADDNAIGELTRTGDGVVIPFPGRTGPKPLAFPAFRQDGTIDGQLVVIGGRDNTAHATLQDGDLVHGGLVMDRELARDMCKLLYGPKLRISGNGKWERHASGVWKLLEFRVDRFEILDDSPLPEVLQDIRGVPGNDLMASDTYQRLTNLRNDDGIVH